MSVTPLFISDMPTLKKRLRLSGAAQGDALAIIDSATETARVLIFDSLGASRVNVLLGKPYTENAVTTDGIQRIKANNLELLIIRRDLLRRMPVLFMDSSGAKRESWNDEGFTRRAEQRELQAEITRLDQEIVDALTDLATDSVSSPSTVQGGIMCRPTVCSPLSLTGSIQDGFSNRVF